MSSYLGGYCKAWEESFPAIVKAPMSKIFLHLHAKLWVLHPSGGATKSEIQTAVKKQTNKNPRLTIAQG